MANNFARHQILQALKSKRRLPKFPKLSLPMAAERAYRKRLRAFVGRIQALIKERLVPQLAQLDEYHYGQRPELSRKDHEIGPNFTPNPHENRPNLLDEHQDAAPDALARIINGIRIQLADEYSDDEFKAWATQYGLEANEHNRRVLASGLRKVIGIDVLAAEPWLGQEIELFAIANTNLITSLRDRALADVQTRVYEAFRAGVRHEELSKDIVEFVDPEVGDVGARADFIARDQISKLNGQLTELRQTEAGVDSYIWRTSLDERVRDTHRRKEGQVFRWDDPPRDTGHPGEDYNCRCTAEPYLEDMLGEDFRSTEPVFPPDAEG